jgi:hypothetical protein
MSKKVTMKATKKAVVTKKATPKKKVVAKKVVKKAVPKKKVVAKKVTKKIVAKKAVAKKATLAKTKGDLKPKAVAKKTKKQTNLEKIKAMYSIVSAYSENLMQDVYSVVYRKKTLKRFVNENLASKYIDQEALLSLGEYNIRTAKKTRALVAELESEGLNG